MFFGHSCKVRGALQPRSEGAHAKEWHPCYQVGGGTNKFFQCCRRALWPGGL